MKRKHTNEEETLIMPSETKGHTPGPWHTNDSRDGREKNYIRCDLTHGGAINGMAVAKVCESAFDHATVRANARLIAAAPELLEACRDDRLDLLHNQLEHFLELEDAGNDEIRDAALSLCSQLCEHYEKRRDAIKKATGQG